MADAQDPGNRSGDVLIGQDPRPDGIVNIVVHIGKAVCPADDPAFQGLRNPVTGMTQNAHADFVSKIQSFAAIFQNVHHTQTLLIMAEGCAGGFRQRQFTGMAKGSMAQVMAHSNSLCQVFVQIQGLCDGSGDTADLNGVGHAGAVVIALGA